MNHLEKWNRSRNSQAALAGGLFLLMLLLNILTPYICDDFTYRLNFLTREPLGSFLEIPESMYAHSYKMNGRLISHGLAQVFMLLPPILFDIVNAAVFVGTLVLTVKLCAMRWNALLFAAAFCLIWLFTPDFGQVVLWQVGAFNYFWSLTACVLFFSPALIRFQTGQDVLQTRFHWFCFCIYAFFFGWYNEIASFVGLCMVICLIVLDVWINRKPLRFWRFLPTILGFAGYFTMLSAPAQTANKQSISLTLSSLMQAASECTWMLLSHCGLLLVLFGILFAIGLCIKLPKKALILSALFALAGVCANYMPIVASYYPLRCMCTTVLMLVMAICFLAEHLCYEQKFPIFCAACVAIFLLTLPSGLTGCRDIVSCHLQHTHREQTIRAALDAGERDVIANTVIPSTPWSGYYGLRDLTTDPDTWPNHSMALYYGLDSLKSE